MFGSLISAAASLRNNSKLTGKRVNYFENENRIKIENNTIMNEVKFENKLTDEERILFIQKLEKKKKQNLLFDNIVILGIILSMIIVFILFQFV